MDDAASNHGSVSSPAQPTNRRFWLAKLKAFLENALVSAVVSAIVSGVCIVSLESRLENSKEYVAEILQQKDNFITAQSNVFSQIGLYTGRLFVKPRDANKEPLQSAIVSLLFQTDNLRDELPKADRDVLNQYADELENMSKEIRDVQTPDDLGPLYASAQKLLQLRDQIDERVSNNSEISVFFSRQRS